MREAKKESDNESWSDFLIRMQQKMNRVEYLNRTKRREKNLASYKKSLMACEDFFSAGTLNLEDFIKCLKARKTIFEDFDAHLQFCNKVEVNFY
jgi:hypothetical protein